ncbi:neuronal membrane glycoprotein M6-a isoform X2 [Lingula anatina]|uniref:Neuronal membrane glycoprotein M6-a isoform X2 n=1 Tax=Lingula anatina TaxID=7574 RepID=A0A1S3IW59_LINAN|nr:neuronal membrane glycoprotein M6-a-like isoform X2 [Lingula anatina]XP_013402201.1 neuronal membrane glycoprotein M6-a isoform X2 [Lingula anatina]|eukprot:XP_013391814.1 neuronal membrane glycoprotein M6-a-like isoform X2 [Lingula anatina]
MGALECLGRIPYASLIATLKCWVGVGIFCGCLYSALRIVLEDIFSKLLGFSIEWLRILVIVLIIVAVVMGIFATLLLIFGFLATGNTRRNVYKGNKCIMGGRVSAAMFMMLTYIMNLTWVLICALLTVPVLMYVMFMSICNEEIIDRQLAGWYPTINISHYGLYRNATALGGKNVLRTPTELSKLCEHISEAGPLFIVAFIGALLIVLSMVQFISILSANYVRLRVSKELQEIRDDVEMTESFEPDKF